MLRGPIAIVTLSIALGGVLPGAGRLQAAALQLAQATDDAAPAEAVPAAPAPEGSPPVDDPAAMPNQPPAPAEATAAPTPLQPETVHRSATVVAVNKWPEGLALSGGSLWVAESGTRSVARIALASQTVVARKTVGRLPVAMLATATGKLFATINTDKKLWRLPDPEAPDAKGRTSTIPDCPVRLAGDDEAVWILTDVDCSSIGSKLYRAHPDDGGMSQVGAFGPGGFDIADVGSRVMLVNTQGEGSTLTFVDKKTGETRGTPLGGKRLHAAASDGATAFAAGDVGPMEAASGVVVASDPLGNVTEMALPQPIGALAAWGGYVIAASRTGTLWVLSSDTLAVARVIETDFAPFEPRSLAADGTALFVSTLKGIGDNGSVLILPDWQPAPAGK